MADGINFGLIPAATQTVQPFDTSRALAELEHAVRTGFITAEDISRAGRRKVQETDQLKTDLQSNEIRRRLMPGEAQNAQTAQEVQAGQLGIQKTILPGQQVLAEKQNQDILDLTDPTKRADALNRKRREGVEVAYAQSVGELPEFFELEKPGKALTFDKWQEQEHQRILQQADQAAAQFPDPNSVEANKTRAQVFNDLEGQFALNSHKAYADYVKKTQTEKAKVMRGTPEYDKEVANRLTQHLQQQAIQEAQLKALPGVLETREKTAGELPEKQAKVAAGLRQEVESSKQIQQFRLQSNAADQVKTLATLPNPSNRTDLQLIYAALKLADPSSVVREGEIALSNNAAPTLIAIKRKLEGITSRNGKLLDDIDRQELVRIADTVIAQAQNNIRPEYQKFQRLATEQNIPLGDVLNPSESQILNSTTSTPPAAPAPGVTDYESLLGKRVTLKNGQSGVVIKLPDGTYSLQP